MYKELVETIEDKIKLSGVIKSTYFGQVVDYFEHNKTFPYCVIEPNGISYDGQYINCSFRLFLLDQRKKDRLNVLPIINEMEQVSQQFLLDMIATNTQPWRVDYNNISSEVEFYTQDEECVGVVLSITFIRERCLE